MTTSLYAGSGQDANPEIEPINPTAELHDALGRHDFDAASRARRALMRPNVMVLPIASPVAPTWCGGGR